MDLIYFLIDFILHIDVHLAELVAEYGVWVYAILFLILFCETGLVVTPFLPGDSLLFVAGALASLETNDLNVHMMVVLMLIAAIVGDVWGGDRFCMVVMWGKKGAEAMNDGGCEAR